MRAWVIVGLEAAVRRHRAAGPSSTRLAQDSSRVTRPTGFGFNRWALFAATIRCSRWQNTPAGGKIGISAGSVAHPVCRREEGRSWLHWSDMLCGRLRNCDSYRKASDRDMRPIYAEITNPPYVSQQLRAVTRQMTVPHTQETGTNSFQPIHRLHGDATQTERPLHGCHG